MNSRREETKTEKEEFLKWQEDWCNSDEALENNFLQNENVRESHLHQLKIVLEKIDEMNPQFSDYLCELLKNKLNEVVLNSEKDPVRLKLAKQGFVRVEEVKIERHKKAINVVLDRVDGVENKRDIVTAVLEAESEIARDFDKYYVEVVRNLEQRSENTKKEKQVFDLAIGRVKAIVEILKKSQVPYDQIIQIIKLPNKAFIIAGESGLNLLNLFADNDMRGLLESDELTAVAIRDWFESDQAVATLLAIYEEDKNLEKLKTALQNGDQYHDPLLSGELIGLLMDKLKDSIDEIHDESQKFSLTNVLAEVKKIKMEFIRKSVLDPLPVESKNLLTTAFSQYAHHSVSLINLNHCFPPT